ncbi:MAG TPA: response regulator [Terriglobales bacterium]|nr:response regulator [Terriglobales bacterium]
MSTPPTVLIVDDDPSHLKLYSWIVQRGGFQAAVALVGSRTVEYPKDRQVDVIALDYRLASTLTAPQIASELRQLFPDAPIIVLSELSWMPAEMEPYAKAFVSKGEPQDLLDLIGQLTGHPVTRRP